MIRSRLKFVKHSVSNPDEILDKMVISYKPIISFLYTVPRANRTSAFIISEIGTDIPIFLF